MDIRTLVLVDVAGIQEYLFASNQLAQNVGASERVREATSDRVFVALKNLNLRHNAREDGDLADWIVDDPRGKDPVEVISCGGGNTLLLFREEHQAKAFARALSFGILRDMPGLQLVVRKTPIDLDAPGTLKDAIALLKRSASERSLPRPISAPLLGLGVTASCDFTGFPAATLHPEPSGPARLISPTVVGKLKWDGETDQAVVDADRRLNQILPEIKDHGFQFTYDFDAFGQRDESRYLAVIHADGNRMRERFQLLETTDNRLYARRLRAFSTSVKRAAVAALRSAVRQLLDYLRLQESPPKRIPFRPLVFGGDDVTLVAEGRWGLALAAAYLRALSDIRLDDGDPVESQDEDTKWTTAPLYSRAGVAIVKSHYPFARAYQLAEAVANSAKKRVKEISPKIRLKRCGDRELDLGQAMVLDWHIATTGALLELSEIRAREYVGRRGGSLLMRPVRIDAANDWRHWETFVDLVAAFREERKGERWGARRNKVKALRQALREGAESVHQFRLNYRIKDGLPRDHANRLGEEQSQNGWAGERCVHFDAVEALDFFEPLA